MTPPATEAPSCWRAVGRSCTERQAACAGAVAAVDGAGAEVKSSASATPEDAVWLGARAPASVYTVDPKLTVAMPWRGVRIAGPGDQVLVVRSSNSTVSKTEVGPSPPAVKSLSPTTAAPRSPRGVGRPANLVHVPPDGS